MAARWKPLAKLAMQQQKRATMLYHKCGSREVARDWHLRRFGCGWEKSHMSREL
jgi:hypothetical protein